MANAMNRPGYIEPSTYRFVTTLMLSLVLHGLVLISFGLPL